MSLGNVRGRQAAAPLIQDDDAVGIGVEEATPLGTAATTRATMQENHRLALRVAALFDVELLTVTHVNHLGVIGLNRRIEIPVRGDVQLGSSKSHGNLLWA